MGRVIVMEGHRVELECLRESDSQPPTSNPQWTKDNTGTLPDHVMLVWHLNLCVYTGYTDMVSPVYK